MRISAQQICAVQSNFQSNSLHIIRRVKGPLDNWYSMIYEEFIDYETRSSGELDHLLCVVI
jgi:hypothetical protein